MLWNIIDNGKGVGFGRFLKTLRVEENESQKEMAKRMELPVGKLSLMELGKLNPDEQFLETLQKYYPVKVVKKPSGEVTLEKVYF